jgi:hypothetical protein
MQGPAQPVKLFALMADFMCLGCRKSTTFEGLR